MDKAKHPHKAASEEAQEDEAPTGLPTPGTAEGDLETIEQDLNAREKGGPLE